MLFCAFQHLRGLVRRWALVQSVLRRTHPSPPEARCCAANAGLRSGTYDAPGMPGQHLPRGRSRYGTGTQLCSLHFRRDAHGEERGIALCGMHVFVHTSSAGGPHERGDPAGWSQTQKIPRSARHSPVPAPLTTNAAARARTLR